MQRSQDVNAPNLKGSSGLNAWAVDILLLWGFLVFYLALMAVWDHPVDLMDKAEHEQSLSAKVRGFINTCLPQELVGRLDDPVP